MTPEQIERELKRLRRLVCCTISSNISENDVRYNPELEIFEYYNGVEWIEVPNSGGGTPEGAALTEYALAFKDNDYGNVWHGEFWDYDAEDLIFFNEAWIVPRRSETNNDWTGYYVSGGYGGSHKFLGGVSFAHTSNTWSATGNVFTGTGSILDQTWDGIDILPGDTLHHVAVIYDGIRLAVYVDGILSGYKPYTNFRVVQAIDTHWFTGGSDHSKFNGLICRLRHYEDYNPVSNAFNYGRYFFPQRVFGWSHPNCALNVDYTVPANIIADHSEGFLGKHHPGRLNALVPLALLGTAGVTDTAFGAAAWAADNATDGRDPSLLPQWEKFSFVKPVYTGGAPVIPVDSVLYDSFSRQDSTPAWNYPNSLGQTEGGSAGVQTWVCPIGYGGAILNKQGIALGDVNNLGIAYAETGISDQDVRVNQTIGDKNGAVIARVTDNSNYLLVQPSGGVVYIAKKVGGSVSNLTNFAFGAAITDIRVVVNGLLWEVYMNGSGVASATGTGSDINDLPLGTKAGFGCGILTRIKKFEVYNV